jgi:hypothetical protein
MGDRCEFSTILERMPNVKGTEHRPVAALIDPQSAPFLQPSPLK